MLIVSCSQPNSNPANATIQVEFQRIPEGFYSPFYVLISSETPIVNPQVSCEDAASIGDMEKLNELEYRVLVTPALSGELDLVVSAENATTVEETLLVFYRVHDDWGQPRKVRGMVNTEGWEDGACISPDGEYLYLQYIAMPFPALIDGSDKDIWNLVQYASGPFTAPLRPDYFRSRIGDDGAIEHTFPLYGVTQEGSQIFPMSSFYGFKKQSDGSFAEPFLLGINDQGNGNLNPFGLSLAGELPDGTVRAFFSFNDPRSNDAEGSNDAEDTGNDIVTLSLVPGEKNIWGEYFNGTAGEILRDEDTFQPQSLEYTLAGNQGNPHVYHDATASYLFTDDEVFDTPHEVDISYYQLEEEGSYPLGPWAGPYPLAGKINLPGSDAEFSDNREVQPYFDGSQLIFSRDSQLYRCDYLGGSPGDDSSWGEVEVLLQGLMAIPEGEDWLASEDSAIFYCGEPSTVIMDNKEILYFIYVIFNGSNLDLNVGYVERTL